MKKAAVIILALLMALPSVYGVSSIEAKAVVDKNKARLGDSLIYNISVKREGSGGSTPEVQPPAFEGFRVAGSYSQNSVSIVNGAATIVTNLQYELIAVKSGEITIPPAKISVVNPATGQREEIETKPVIVTVSGGSRNQSAAVAAVVPTATPEEDIKEIKLSTMFRFSDLIPYIILAVLFIIAVIVAWKLIFAKKPLAPALKEEISYKEEAQKMIAKAAGRLMAGDIKAYYYEIYEAVRYFLSGHLGESYAELTTQEIMKQINGKLSDGKVSRILKFMSDCDMVKFADYKPDEKEADAASAMALEIVEKT